MEPGDILKMFETLSNIQEMKSKICPEHNDGKSMYEKYFGNDSKVEIYQEKEKEEQKTELLPLGLKLTETLDSVNLSIVDENGNEDFRILSIGKLTRKLISYQFPESVLKSYGLESELIDGNYFVKINSSTEHFLGL